MPRAYLFAFLLYFFFGLYSEINRPVIVRMVPSATSRVILSCRTIAEVMTVMTGTI